MKGTLLALMLTLGLLAPAYAELTVPEVGDIRQMIEATRDHRQSQSFVLSVIVTAPKAVQPKLAEIQERFTSAQNDHRLALMNCLHFGPNNTPIKPTFEDTHWAERCYFHWKRYTEALDNPVSETNFRFPKGLKQLLTEAQKLVTDPKHVDDLRRAKDIHLANAIATAGSITLGANLWAEPYPALRSVGCKKREANGAIVDIPCTMETVVGPHGDYRGMGWAAGRGIHYLTQDAFGAWNKAYRAGTVSGKLTRDFYTQHNLALNAEEHAIALLANVPMVLTMVVNVGDVTMVVPSYEVTEDRFCRTLRALRLVMIDAADARKAGGIVASQAVQDKDAAQVVNKLFDSAWHAIGLTSWKAMLFVENTRCADPQLNK